MCWRVILTAVGETLHVEPSSKTIASNGILEIIPAQTRYPSSKSAFMENRTDKMMIFVPKIYPRVNCTCSCSKYRGASCTLIIFNMAAAVPNPMYNATDSTKPINKMTAAIITKAANQIQAHWRFAQWNLGNLPCCSRTRTPACNASRNVTGTSPAAHVYLNVSNSSGLCNKVAIKMRVRPGIQVSIIPFGPV